MINAGFTVDRQSGSHVTLKKPGHRFIVTIPMHTKPLKEGTLRNIIRQAGLTVDEFLEHLGR